MLDAEAHETFNLCWGEGEEQQCVDKAVRGKCVIIDCFDNGKVIEGVYLKECQRRHGKDTTKRQSPFG